MKMKHAAIIGVSAIATLVCAPIGIAANAKGEREMHSFHFGKHFRSARHNKNFNNQWPWWGYGGLYAVPPYDLSYNGDYAQPRTVVFVSQSPSRAQLSKEQGDQDSPSGRWRHPRDYDHTLLTEIAEDPDSPRQVVGRIPMIEFVTQRLSDHGADEKAGFGHRHTGKLSCFLAGISTCLFFSIASARAMRRRVECGMITSSI